MNLLEIVFNDGFVRVFTSLRSTSKFFVTKIRMMILDDSSFMTSVITEGLISKFSAYENILLRFSHTFKHEYMLKFI